MKKYTLLVCLIVTIFGYYKSFAQSASVKQDTKFMIRHSVIFKLKYPENSAEAKEFFIATKKLANIPGVQNFECLKQTSKKNNFEYGLSMEFASQQLYDAYSNHPDHVMFIQQYWLKYVDGFLEIDYEPLQ